jgi:branched-chain amino acid transport system permease protein
VTRRIGWLEVVFWLALAAGYVLWPSQLPLASQVLIAGLFALSYDLILGYAGILSLGHAAYFGVGAYAAGLLAAHGWGEPISGLIAAGLVAALAGLITSPLVVRGTDLTRLMITTGLGLLLFELANRLGAITGGVDGLQGVEIQPLLGTLRFDIYGRTAYGYVLAVVFVLFLAARRLVRSPFGLGLRGIRANPLRMRAIGCRVDLHLAAVYTFSAACAGVAGALLTQTTQFVGLDVLSFGRSAELLVMLIVGGAGLLYGGFVGAAVFMIAHHYLSSLDPVYWQFWLGAGLVLIVLVGRDGILGLGHRILNKRRLRPATTS